MDAVRAIRLEMGRAVVVVLFRASDVEAILLQADPKVRAICVALRTWFTLFEFAQLHQREMDNVVQMRTLGASTAGHCCLSFR